MGQGSGGCQVAARTARTLDSLATAEREFRSEIGEPPQHEVKGQVLVRRCVKW